MSETDVSRVLRLLQVAIRMLGFSNREVERRLQWTPGYMTRILKGNIELKVEHLVEISGALGLSPRELLLFAFPDSGEEPTPASVKLEAVVEEIRPFNSSKPRTAQAPPAQAITLEDVDRRIEMSLQRFFARMASSGS